MSKNAQALVEVTSNVPVLVESADDGKVYVQGIASEAGVKNQNGRIYPIPVMEKAVADAQGRIAEGAFTGQLDHPEYGYRGSLSKTAIKFTELFMEGAVVKYKAEVLGTTDGRELKELLKAGVKVGMSTRGSGSLKVVETAGEPEHHVDDDFYMYGIDAVDIPSSETGIMRLQESLERQLSEQKGLNTMAQKEIKTLAELKEAYGPLVTEAEEAAKAEANSSVEAGASDLQEVKSELAQAKADLVEARKAYDAVKQAVLGEKADSAKSEVDVLAKLDALTETVANLNQKLVESQEALEKEKQRGATLKLINEAFETEVAGKPFESILRKRVNPELFESVDAMKAQVTDLRDLLSEVPTVHAAIKEGKEEGKGIVEAENENSKVTLTEEELTTRRLLGNRVQKGN